MSKLQKYIGALRAAEQTVANTKLKSDLAEIRQRIESGFLTWRESLGGRDEFLTPTRQPAGETNANNP